MTLRQRLFTIHHTSVCNRKLINQSNAVNKKIQKKKLVVTLCLLVFHEINDPHCTTDRNRLSERWLSSDRILKPTETRTMIHAMLSNIRTRALSALGTAQRYAVLVKSRAARQLWRRRDQRPSLQYIRREEEEKEKEH